MVFVSCPTAVMPLLGGGSGSRASAAYGTRTLRTMRWNSASASTRDRLSSSAALPRGRDCPETLPLVPVVEHRGERARVEDD